MALNNRHTVLASGGLMALVCLLYILSNALPYWSSVNNIIVKTHAGLWRVCADTGYGMQCVSTYNSCSSDLPSDVLSLCHKLLGAKAFMTLACLFSAFSVMSILLNLMANSNRMIVMISKILPFACFVCGITGVSLGISYITSEIYASLEGAAILGIIAILINFTGAVVSTFIQ